jgi:hypothetical protein
MAKDKEKIKPPEIIPPVEEIKPPEIIPPVDELPLINADKELAKLTEEMPRVEAEAVAAAQDKEKIEAAPLLTEKLDKVGRRFDVGLHIINLDGTPRITEDGFLMTKRGRKSKVILPDRVKPETQAAGQVQVNEAINRRYTAIVAASMFIQTGVAIFGDEWQPEKSKETDEKENLINATDDYFKVVGFKQLPPWAGLAVAYASYGFRRFNRPVTKTKLQTLGEWFKKKSVGVYSWFINRKKKKPAIIPQDKDVKVEVPDKEEAPK